MPKILERIRERPLFGLPTLAFCFALIILDGKGTIDLGKFGYAGIGSWITLILQFYYRRAQAKEPGDNG